MNFIELSDKHAWHCLDYAATYDLSANFIDNVPREDATKLSVDEFVEQYEKHYKPVVFTSTQLHWQANEKWTFEVYIKVVQNPLGLE